ncbi:MAG: succinate dehydrogenase, hydrophobic membrane anchor protein [Bauldia sp.]
MTGKTMRTPMRGVLGLGSARSGTEHFWRQRVTGAANAILVVAFVIIVVSVAGRPYAEVLPVLSSPLVAVMLLLLVVSVTVHMRIGMQVVVEDYVRSEGLKVVLLIANTFFTVAVGAVCVVAILKLAFGA